MADRQDPLFAYVLEKAADDCTPTNQATGGLTFAARRHQASTFPISGDDFRAIVDLLGDTLTDVSLLEAISDFSPSKLAQIEARYINASPEVKERLSRSIERGPIGTLVKKANGYRCQLCEVLQTPPLGFRKKARRVLRRSAPRDAGGDAPDRFAVSLECHNGLRQPSQAASLRGCRGQYSRRIF